MIWDYGAKLNDIKDPATDYLTQILFDWSTVPFVNITVTSEWTCPEGQSEVFTRPWYGM